MSIPVLLAVTFIQPPWSILLLRQALNGHVARPLLLIRWCQKPVAGFSALLTLWFQASIKNTNSICLSGWRKVSSLPIGLYRRIECCDAVTVWPLFLSRCRPAWYFPFTDKKIYQWNLAWWIGCSGKAIKERHFPLLVNLVGRFKRRWSLQGRKMKNPFFRSESLLSIFLCWSDLARFSLVPFFSTLSLQRQNVLIHFLVTFLFWWYFYIFLQLYGLFSTEKKNKKYCCSIVCWGCSLSLSLSSGFLSLKLFPAFICFSENLGCWLTPVMATCRNLKASNALTKAILFDRPTIETKSEGKRKKQKTKTKENE